MNAPHFVSDIIMHPCKICKKKFTLERNLKRHVTSVHWRLEGKCKQCGKGFTRKDNLRRHEINCKTSTKKRKQKEEPEQTPPPKKQRTQVEEDPQECPRHLPPTSLAEDCQQCYRQNWHQIRTRQRGGQFVESYLHRLEEGNDLSAIFRNIFEKQKSAFKVNMAFGFILKNEETGEVRYYYPSQNGYVFENPIVIRNGEDLAKFMKKIEGVDWQEYIRQQKPNSKWTVALITNVAFVIYKLPDHPIGRGKSLPSFVIENRGLDALETDKNTGELYEDNLCFFRCLARHRGCNLKNLERTTKQLASEYMSSLAKLEEFQGVKLLDLYHLDEVFAMHTFVYCLEEDGKVRLIHRPAKILTQLEADSAMKLNLCDGHFSYIKDMKKYAKSYQCSRCDKFFKRPWEHERHERTCEAKIKHIYPGGVYHPPKTIFEKIEEEGIVVPEELKYSKYRATYDIEVYYPKTELPENRPKLEWTAEHRLLSISVASNVPGYEEPKCFVVEGEGEKEAQQLVREFDNYLNEIAGKAYELENQESRT